MALALNMRLALKYHKSGISIHCYGYPRINRDTILFRLSGHLSIGQIKSKRRVTQRL
jgi:hypothetical protein